MKKFVDFLFVLFTVAEFGLIGWICSMFNLNVAVVCGIVGLAYQMNYIKQTEVQNQIFELKQLIEKNKTI